MKNYKKIMGIMALTAMSFALAACGSPADKSGSSEGGGSESELLVDASKENVDYETTETTVPVITTTTTTTTTTDAEDTTDTTETTAAGGGSVDPARRKTERKNEAEVNTYDPCSMFGYTLDSNSDKVWCDLNSYSEDTTLQGVITKFGFTPIEGDAASYSGSMTEFGFTGKGYYTIPNNKDSAKAYFMTSDKGEVIGVAFTDFGEKGFPLAGNNENYTCWLRSKILFSDLYAEFNQGYHTEGQERIFNGCTDDGYSYQHHYYSYSDGTYSIVFSNDSEYIDGFMVIRNDYIDEKNGFSK